MSGSKESAALGCFSKVEAKKSCPPARNISHPLRYYEFTQEEIKVLEECDQESFYQRCIPISTLFATMTYAGIKYGLVRRNPHFGAVPKVLTSATFGYCLGRISYKSEYDRKIRRLSASSHLGNVMRRYYLESNPPDPKKR